LPDLEFLEWELLSHIGPFYSEARRARQLKINRKPLQTIANNGRITQAAA
jgi:hypothetical protein